VTPLPAHKYIPGETARHPEGAFEAIRALALLPTETATAHENPPWIYGLRLIAAGYYWEAHEVWEPVWLNAHPNSAERFMCQSVIQLANAALKRDMGKLKAAERLCSLADGLIQSAMCGGVSAPMGIEPYAVETAIALIRRDIALDRTSPINLI
jgi:hypothetical protein